MLLETVLPSNVDTSSHFWSTDWQNSEKEVVARNIVLISLWGGDSWSSFTWGEYIERCEHSVSHAEQTTLGKLAGGGYLTKEGDHYVITESFLHVLRDYIKKG